MYPPTREILARPVVEGPEMTLEALYDRSAAIAFVRQRRFRGHIGDRIWWVDPQNGIARLYTPARQPVSGDLPIQILGSEGDGHWLWEWANPLNVVPPAARQAADQLRALGAEEGIDELTTPRLESDALINPDVLASIALATCDAQGYFVHRAGALRVGVVLIDESLRTPEDTSFVRFAHTINEVVRAGLPLSDARDVIEGYLDALGIEYEADDDGDIFASTETNEMQVVFEGNSFEFNIRDADG